MAVLGLVAIVSILPQPALANFHEETPWHTIAHAYLNSIFLINLKPIDWDLVEKTWKTDLNGRIEGEPASVRLQDIDQAADTAHWQAIETALVAKRPDALYAAATKAISAGIRKQLAFAAANLETPGFANVGIDEAQALYRAFADFIQQTDPDGFRALGLAWLEIASSVRQVGVVSVGTVPADRVSFEIARTIISDYLTNNFEPDVFEKRSSFVPIPEKRFIANPNAKVAAWLPPGSEVQSRDPTPRLALNFKQHGIDEANLFLVAYGDMLFSSAELFGDPAKSLGLTCSTCHHRGDINRRFFIPGISSQPGNVDLDGSFFNARVNDHRADPIDIPSLRGLRFTGPYGRDGRFASLRDLIRHIIVNDFKGEEPSPLVLDALIAYVSEFDFLSAPHLRHDGRLKDSVSKSARRGEAIFNKPFEQMNGQSCASCHRPGSHFTDNQMHDIGSAGNGGNSGFSGAYDTPTLLGTAHTAPFFHDGRFPSLGDVVIWFNEQFSLGLGKKEMADLTAYLEAVGEGGDPYQAHDEEDTPFRLMIERLTVMLSALDVLIPDRDLEHADLLLRTVAGGIEMSAGAMTSRDARDKTLALAEHLWQIRDLITRESWEEAELALNDCRAEVEDKAALLQ